MSETASISSGIAERYATAVFGIAREEDAIDTLERDVDILDTALKDSADLRDLISSPVYSRDEQEAAIGTVAERAGLSPVMANTLRLMAQKRRLFAMPGLIAQLRTAIADAKGEVTAEVTAPAALTDAQAAKLSETLNASVGKDIKLNTTVDESLIGGLIVKVGSRMIDTSIRAKLDALQNTMKEAR